MMLCDVVCWCVFLYAGVRCYMVVRGIVCGRVMLCVVVRCCVMLCVVVFGCVAVL